MVSAQDDMKLVRATRSRKEEEGKGRNSRALHFYSTPRESHRQSAFPRIQPAALITRTACVQCARSRACAFEYSLFQQAPFSSSRDDVGVVYRHPYMYMCVYVQKCFPLFFFFFTSLVLLSKRSFLPFSFPLSSIPPHLAALPGYARLYVLRAFLYLFLKTRADSAKIPFPSSVTRFLVVPSFRNSFCSFLLSHFFLPCGCRMIS